MKKIMTIIALTGAILNIGGRWEGFAFWTVSNAYWTFYNLKRQEYEQAVIFWIFWLLSLWGLISWSRS